MKRKEVRALHQKSPAELTQELKRIQQELLRLRLDKQVKREKNTRRQRNLKRDIARISSVIAEIPMKEKGDV